MSWFELELATTPPELLVADPVQTGDVIDAEFVVAQGVSVVATIQGTPMEVITGPALYFNIPSDWVTGDYTISVTATDDVGNSSTVEKSIHITGVPVGPAEYTDAASGNLILGGEAVESYSTPVTYTDEATGDLKLGGRASEEHHGPRPEIQIGGSRPAGMTVPLRKKPQEQEPPAQAEEFEISLPGRVRLVRQFEMSMPGSVLASKEFEFSTPVQVHVEQVFEMSIPIKRLPAYHFSQILHEDDELLLGC